MEDLDTFDDLDLQILQALHLDARVSFTHLAAVLGTSDQTVARRYARMRADGALVVRGRIDPARVGHLEWVVRIRCTPGTSHDVGVALARREDTSWVSQVSGGTELVCITTAPTSADEVLLQALPRSARVLEVTAHCLLHTFCGRTGGVVTRIDALGPDQISALRRTHPAPDPFPTMLHDPDRRILDALRIDGRASLTRLHQITGLGSTTIQRRIETLRSTGTLYFDIDTQRRRLGVRARTLLWLTTSAAQLAATGAALATHPEVAFAAATTGTFNIHASIATTTTADLYRYIAETASTLPDLQRLETALVLATIKGSPDDRGPSTTS